VAGANSHSNGDGIHEAESGRMGSMQGQVGVRQLFRQHFGSLQHLIITLLSVIAASFIFSLARELQREKHVIPLLRKDIACSHMDGSSKYNGVSIWRDIWAPNHATCIC
jgi:hypothetical protein